jgi:hypothetical protein
VSNGTRTLQKLDRAGRIVSSFRTGQAPFGLASGGVGIWTANAGSDSVSTSRPLVRTTITPHPLDR